jgi:uncharacterized protein
MHDESYHVTDNPEGGRFEMWRVGPVPKLISYATYRHRDGTDTLIPHVETDPTERGNGMADRLMEGVLDQLEAAGRTVTPLCPFAADHIRDRPERHDLLTS